MVIAISDSRDEELRKIIRDVAEICLSEEFQELRSELEKIYFQKGIENVLLTAFQDALYALLSQREVLRNSRPLVY